MSLANPQNPAWLGRDSFEDSTQERQLNGRPAAQCQLAKATEEEIFEEDLREAGWGVREEGGERGFLY